MFYVKILNLHKKIDNNDFLSKNDLYVNIHYGGIQKSTRVKHNTELPIWNEEFIFPIKFNINDFTIEIKDHNTEISDNILSDNTALSDKILLIKIVDVNYGDIKEINVDNKLIMHYGNIFYHKNYEINSLQNKIFDLGKVIEKLENNNNILTEKIENIKKIAN